MSDKFAILGILMKEELHGYEISNRLKVLEGFWYISPGNLYRALNSLEKDGMVEVARTEENQGKMRKIYRVTEKGREEFDDWVSVPAGIPRVRHEGYLKIWFCSENRENAVTQIKQIRDASENILNMLKDHDLSRLPKYVRWMMEAGKAHALKDIEWSDSCLMELKTEEAA